MNQRAQVGGLASSHRPCALRCPMGRTALRRSPIVHAGAPKEDGQFFGLTPGSTTRGQDLDARIESGEFSDTGSTKEKITRPLRQALAKEPLVGRFIARALADLGRRWRAEAAKRMPEARGDIREIVGQPVFVPLYKLFLMYGKIFRLSFGPKSFVVISDPAFAKQILLTNAERYSKGLLSEILDFVMGTGLIPADGEIWKARRRAVVPALHRKVANEALGKPSPAIPSTVALYWLPYSDAPANLALTSQDLATVSRGRSVLKELHQGSGATEVAVSFADAANATLGASQSSAERLTGTFRPTTPLSVFGSLNLTSRARWVLRVADLGENWQDSRQITLESWTLVLCPPDNATLPAMLELNLAQQAALGSGPLKGAQRGLASAPRLQALSGGAMLPAVPTLVTVASTTTFRTQSELADQTVVEEEDEEFGEEFLSARDPSILHFLVASGDEISSKQLRDDLMTMLIAGHETTAAVLTWTLYTLAQHPEAAEAIRQEVDAVLGDRAPTVADFGSLRFTTRVINESMRLYPQPPVLIRRALQEDSFDGFVVPAGSDIFISVWNLHRNPASWDQPDAFKPERWGRARAFGPLDGPMPNEVTENFAYLPFGGGRRKCIGDQFALFESVVALSMLMRRYTFELDTTKPPVGMTTGATIHTTAGLHMLVKKRDLSGASPSAAYDAPQYAFAGSPGMPAAAAAAAAAGGCPMHAAAAPAAASSAAAPEPSPAF
ncbi:Protein LUTEIN DEFICIENT 5, chloroplastic [Tetrabaena socialis]|uniref:Protein LUTEIN DEFICIENT 5, chloroplastic n=1 Tax=Tetrabaena socialis TaxID=47790 RepID=A0A2J8ABC5_9CHLO|nr:Protein LUTEIN DEFICIENT 5, chloroplastic [Tetrabaena socialis]|eukprot:PNH09806.1 Protein LUTEIN DEFICIENT 5, chloroplastic [Tetrabaena socialis]